MSEPESMDIAFEDGLRSEGPVTCVSPGLVRLGWTPLFTEIEAYFGDVVEVERTTDGSHRFVRIVERGSFAHEGWVVGPAFLGSDYFEAFVIALEAAGGVWEVPVNGYLLTHVPVGSTFDVDEQLYRERVRAYQAGIVDTPQSEHERPQS